VIRTGAQPLGSSSPSLKGDLAIYRRASEPASSQGTTASAAPSLLSSLGVDTRNHAACRREEASVCGAESWSLAGDVRRLDSMYVS
jgi:hypothetical protein